MNTRWNRKVWLSLLLIIALLAVGLTVPGTTEPAQARGGQPLVFLKDGDLWSWDGATVRQLTTWGYNERPVISPDGYRVAYNSWATIVVDFLATNPGIGGFIPSNIWVIDPVTEDAFRVADQPANASWLQPGVTDNVIVRGTPAWSPDSRQLVWAEMVIPQGNYQLVAYDFASGTSQTLVQQLPYPWADAGNVMMPIVEWGQTGIAVRVVAVNSAAGDFEERLYLYAPSGGLVNDTLIGGSATEWPAAAGWITANGQEYFGVTYGSGKRLLVDPVTGEQTPMPGVPERFSTAAPTGNVSAYPSSWIDAAGNVKTSWTATYASDTQKQDLPFSGTTDSIAIAPDGQSLAYISDAVYVWSNGTATAVPGTQGIGSSWGVGLVWGSNAWRIRSEVASGLGGGAIACSPAPRLSVGMAAQVLPGLPNIVRTQPRRGADSAIVGEIPGGASLLVLDGPQCGPEGRYWWFVNYQGLQGWTAEGQSGVYWIQPAQGPIQGCPMPTRLTVGTTAYITPGTPNVIRTYPRRGADSIVIGWIPGNGVFKVLAGPQCGPEGRHWWQVEYAGITGWTAEGENGIYWAAPFGCPASPLPRLAAGMQARITPGLPNNLRTAPSSSAAAVGQIPAGGVFTILSGPVCGPEGWSYWRVQYGNQIGWTAEGDGGTYWIEPLGINTPIPPTPTPLPVACTLPPRMQLGAAGVVTPGLPNVIRTQPRRGTDSPVITEMPAGSFFGVEAGPVCGPEGRYWWRIDYAGVKGWTPEGEGTTYWIEPWLGDGPGTGPVPGVCTLTPRLTVGTTAYVLPGPSNVIRSVPGTGADSTVIGQIPGSGVFVVKGGPVCGNDNRYWWQLDYQGVKGWTAEGENSTYWVGPFRCVSGPPPRLQPGMTGRVLPGDPNVIRSGPGTGPGSAVIGQIPGGGVFSVLASGPQCGNDGRTWWQVNYQGAIGWTAEGEGGTYWIEPVN